MQLLTAGLLHSADKSWRGDNTTDDRRLLQPLHETDQRRNRGLFCAVQRHWRTRYCSFCYFNIQDGAKLDSMFNSTYFGNNWNFLGYCYAYALSLTVHRHFGSRPVWHLFLYIIIYYYYYYYYCYITFVPEENPSGLKNYQISYKICLLLHPTRVGRYQ